MPVFAGMKEYNEIFHELKKQDLPSCIFFYGR